MENVPQAGLPEPFDPDIKISNRGQRIRAILVALVAVGAALGAIYWYTSQQKELSRHKNVKIAFHAAHTAGYSRFFRECQINVESMKSNEDFELRMKNILSGDPVRYAKHIKKKCLPVIDDALPKYRSIETPSAYAGQMEHVINMVVLLRSAWHDFSNELLKYEGYFGGMKSLEKMSSAWLGALQSGNPKHVSGATRYFRLLQCVLPTQKVEEIESSEINFAIQNSCLSEKDSWFRRVAYECIPGLLEKAPEPDDHYKAAIKMAKKSVRPDHASKFGIEDCLESTRTHLESTIIEPLAKTWRDYIIARNELIATMNKTLRDLQ